MDTKSILAHNTRTLRVLKHQSQLECADDVGISKSVLSDIERAQAKMPRLAKLWCTGVGPETVKRVKRLPCAGDVALVSEHADGYPDGF